MRGLDSAQYQLLRKILSVYHPQWVSRLDQEQSPAARELARIADYLEQVLRALKLFVPAGSPAFGVTERGGDAVVAYFSGSGGRRAGTYYLMIDVSGFTKLLTFLTDRFGKQEAGDIMNMSILNRYCLNRVGELIRYYGGGSDGESSAGEDALKVALTFRSLLGEVTQDVRRELRGKLAGKPHQNEIQSFIRALEIRASAGIVAAQSSGGSGFYGHAHRMRITWGKSARHLASSEKVGGGDDTVSPELTEVKGIGFDRTVAGEFKSLEARGWIEPEDYRTRRFGAFDKLVLTPRGERKLSERVRPLFEKTAPERAATTPAKPRVSGPDSESELQRIARTAGQLGELLPYFQGPEIVEQVVRGLGSGGELQHLFGERASRVHETGILFCNFTIAGARLLDDLAEVVQEVMVRYGLLYKYNIFPHGDFNLMASLGMGIAGAAESDRVYAEVLWQCWRDLLATAGKHFGERVVLRSGMSVGQCLQGPVGDNLLHDELTIIGPDCNLAARLVARALSKRSARNTLVVADNCFKPLSHLIQRIAPFELAALKGFKDPVPLYLARPRKEHESPAAFAARLREMPLVTGEGQVVERSSKMALDPQLAQAEAFLEDFQKKKFSASRLIALVGPNGIGKTRRMAEIMQRCHEKGWELIFGECLSWYQGGERAAGESEEQSQALAVPYHPFIRILKEQVLEIPPQEDSAAALARIGKKIAQLTGASYLAGRAEILAAYLGLESGTDNETGGLSPEERRNIFFELTAEMFERIISARRKTLLLCIDDLQWADPGSLKLLNFLRGRVKGGLLLCVTARERKEVEPLIGTRDRAGAESDFLLLESKPLGERGSRMLARVALDLDPQAKLPLALRRRLGELEDNPLFIVEFCRKLLEHEVLFVRDRSLQRLDEEKLARVSVPHRVQSVIEELVNGLPRGEYDLIRQASVLGNILSCRDVTEINHRLSGDSGMVPEQVQQALHRLAGRKVLEIEQDRGPDSLYRFSRALIGQSLYEGLTPSLKKRLHGLAAAIWEKSPQDKSLEKNLNCAMHYELAEVPDKAAGYYLSSGSLAADQFENEKAVQLLGRVERFCGQHKISRSAELMLEVHALRSDSALSLGGYDQALADAAGLRSLALRRKQRELAVRSLLLAGRVFLTRARSGDFSQALAKYRQAEKDPGAGNLLKLESQNGEARVLLEMGRPVQAGKKSRIYLGRIEGKRRRGAGDPRETLLKAGIYRTLGSSLMRIGKKTEALEIFESALGRLEKETGSVFLPVIAQLLNSKGLALAANFRLQEGLDVYYKARSIARKIGDINLQLIILNNMSVALNDLGENPKALDLLVSSYETITRLAGENRSLAGFEFNMGESFHFMEDYAKAEQHYRRALEITRRIESRQFMVNIMYNLGECLRDQGKLKEAKSVLEEGSQIALRSGYSQQELDLENILGEMEFEEGRLPQAEKRHRRALEIARELEDDFCISWSLRNLAADIFEGRDRAGYAEAAKMLLESDRYCIIVRQPENHMETLTRILRYWNKLGLEDKLRADYLAKLEELATKQKMEKYLELCRSFKAEAAGNRG